MLTGDVPFHGENQVAVAMHHVRDELPDVQSRRPEVSSSLAAVVDRATSKDLDHRYRDAQGLIADLEDALTAESSRSGHLTGEATTVFRSLPEQKRRRVPGGVVHPGRWLAAIAVVALIVVAAFALLADRAERGTGTPRTPAPPELTAVSLRAGSAEDYDPLGDEREHPEESAFLVDNERSTTWSTERYLDGNLAKDGVGITIDARPSLAARAMVLRTPTPGWAGAVYAAAGGERPAAIDDPAWKQVGTIDRATRRTRVDLDTAGRRFRWYLIWITDFAPGQDKVELSDVTLYR
jgi:serine/threonine-protein kinase